MMPAQPPKNAISTSHSVGVVRATSSACGWVSGLARKYSVDVSMLSTTKMSRPRAELRIRPKSLIAAP